MSKPTKEQEAGRAAYEEATKDVKIARKWGDLEPDEQKQWIENATADSAGAGDDEKADPGPPEPEPPSEAVKAVAKVNGAKAAAKSSKVADDTLPIGVQPVSLDSILTLRDTAKAAYYQKEGADAPAFESIGAAAIERWEQDCKE